MGRKETPFPHLQFMTQSVPPRQIVIMLGKGTRPLSGAQPECSVLPPLILHFNHCSDESNFSAVYNNSVSASNPSASIKKIMQNGGRFLGVPSTHISFAPRNTHGACDSGSVGMTKCFALLARPYL